MTDTDFIDPCGEIEYLKVFQRYIMNIQTDF